MVERESARARERHTNRREREHEDHHKQTKYLLPLGVHKRGGMSDVRQIVSFLADLKVFITDALVLLNPLTFLCRCSTPVLLRHGMAFGYSVCFTY